MSDLRVRPAAEADPVTLVRLRDDATPWIHAEGEPQPGGPPTSFALLEKDVGGRPTRRP